MHSIRVCGIDDYIDRVVGCNLMEYLKFRRLIFIFELLKNESPDYLFAKLSRSARSDVLILHRHSTSQYNKSFFVSSVEALEHDINLQETML